VISVEEYLDVCDAALDGYAQVCRALGDDLVSVRLDDVPGSNSAFGLVAHVVGVMAWWGRTVNRGIAVPRDRDAEFRATGTVDEALALLDAGRAGLHEDVAAAKPREAPVAPPPPEDDIAATQGGVLLHIYEELTQHLGQLEVTRDVLLSRNR
jgi:hypothetical protein